MDIDDLIFFFLFIFFYFNIAPLFIYFYICFDLLVLLDLYFLMILLSYVLLAVY
ncbi:hypothetical protein PPACK8108_LOCUS2713 [Phakopsora pachyrhizi]|uniref:Uncharacterized protein n=1 Tax=Phakopsora pachyrhizi TaxID=170000 RepID=A0AAV0AL20_PHAPC|nr:hypothetical protein PPACK8108_LOCUS2713 [Phakopsora pachyrhizi]